MADITAINYYRPKMMVPDGRGCTIIEKAAIPASTVIGTNDTVSFAMPAGVTVHRLRIHSDDIDAGTAMVFRAGYLKQNSADTLTADDDYFAAAGRDGCASAERRSDGARTDTRRCLRAGPAVVPRSQSVRLPAFR